jgi:hypothetical protein
VLRRVVCCELEGLNHALEHHSVKPICLSVRRLLLGDLQTLPACMCLLMRVQSCSAAVGHCSWLALELLNGKMLHSRSSSQLHRVLATSLVACVCFLGSATCREQGRTYLNVIKIRGPTRTWRRHKTHLKHCLLARSCLCHPWLRLPGPSANRCCRQQETTAGYRRSYGIHQAGTFNWIKLAQSVQGWCSRSNRCPLWRQSLLLLHCV